MARDVVSFWAFCELSLNTLLWAGCQGSAKFAATAWVFEIPTIHHCDRTKDREEGWGDLGQCLSNSDLKNPKVQWKLIRNTLDGSSVMANMLPLKIVCHLYLFPPPSCYHRRQMDVPWRTVLSIHAEQQQDAASLPIVLHEVSGQHSIYPESSWVQFQMSVWKVLFWR